MIKAKLNILLILIVLILSGCATTSRGLDSDVVFVPTKKWWEATSQSNDDHNLQPLNSLPFNVRSNLSNVHSKIELVDHANFVIAISSAGEINAFAQSQNNQNYVILTQGFLLEFGSDPDVLATVIGHELAHHQLGHTQADYGKNRALAIDISSQALGMISSYFIPFSGLIVGNAVKGAGLAYNRDDERAADILGMELALAAGYSPCGSYRFSSRMNQLSKSGDLTFLSTHPGNNERMENANNFVVQLHLDGCGQ